MLLGFFGKCLQEFGLGWHHAHVPRHRLHDDASDFVAYLIEKFLHARHIVVLERERVLGEVSRHALAARLPRRKHARTRLDEQAVAMAVVATFKLHNLVATGKTASRTDSAHRRLGAAVHHANHLDTRNKAHHELRKFRFQAARSAKAEPVLRRLGDCLDYRIMRVSQEHRAPATHVVDIVVAIHIVDMAPLRTGNKRRRRPHVTVRTHRAVHATRHQGFRFCKEFFA